MFVNQMEKTHTAEEGDLDDIENMGWPSDKEVRAVHSGSLPRIEEDLTPEASNFGSGNCTIGMDDQGSLFVSIAWASIGTVSTRRASLKKAGSHPVELFSKGNGCCITATWPSISLPRFNVCFLTGKGGSGSEDSF